MQERDTGPDQRRAPEEQYFRKRDQELIERMRRQAAIEKDRQLMGKAIGVSDDEVLADLQMAGYNAETIPLLELAPPIEIAWADGRLSKPEHDLIVQMAARHRVIYNSPTDLRLKIWLEHKPPDHFFETSLRAIQAMLDAIHQPQARAALRHKLVHDCRAVATASGGFFGRRKFSEEEERALTHITAALELRRTRS